ncbi:DUF4328 domain-containing protein [Actinomadura barringtoniae]|uniref:DUF4328 domain-containing protein n=1 Tax=Actinomadura barringtoniae TaxID=1427535 RepID=A0A939P641_9ACTN|nr:DUF4328 domain-containing protein [Actinomadura barringtoniae]MBO2445978.1 DUF4328 domain-containing protein [Actinomadura barringtoniae]
MVNLVGGFASIGFDLHGGRPDPASTLSRGVMTLVTALGFLWWQLRAYDNVDRMGGPPQRWTKGWNVLGYVVPIASFWVPYAMVREIWRRSAVAPSTRLVTAWWVAYAGGEIAGVASSAAGDHTALNISLALTPVRCAAGALAIAMIWRITYAQERRLPAPPAVPAPEGRQQPRNGRLTVVALLGGVGLLAAVVIAGLLLHHPASSATQPDEIEKAGRAYGQTTMDPDACDQEAAHRYSDSTDRLLFSAGCVESQANRLVAPAPTNP